MRSLIPILLPLALGFLAEGCRRAQDGSGSAYDSGSQGRPKGSGNDPHRTEMLAAKMDSGNQLQDNPKRAVAGSLGSLVEYGHIVGFQIHNIRLRLDTATLCTVQVRSKSPHVMLKPVNGTADPANKKQWAGALPAGESVFQVYFDAEAALHKNRAAYSIWLSKANAKSKR
jgi:hypothetical protein